MTEDVKDQQRRYAKIHFDKQYEKDGKHSWLLRDDNKSSWPHTICLNEFSPFLKSIPKSKFLVLGDGNGAREGRFIKKHGHYVKSCDWGTTWLEVAKHLDLIDDFSWIDMEDIQLPDNSFDYCFVKESLHHLQYPYKCIYDMHRVASNGILIIEPNDHTPTHKKSIDKFTYESVGNFKYEFSMNELIKCSYSLCCKWYAYCFTNHPAEKYIKDLMNTIPYNSGIDFTKSVENLYSTIKERNRKLKFPHGLPLLNFSMFKYDLSLEQINTLERQDFIVRKIPENPYIQRK